MKAIIEDNYVRIIVLDISGIYAQIYEQGYFMADSIEVIQCKYADSRLWLEGCYIRYIDTYLHITKA